MQSLADIILHTPCAVQCIAHLTHIYWLQLQAAPSHPPKDPVSGWITLKKQS